MLLLFETPAGYSLFKVKDEDKLKDIDVRLSICSSSSSSSSSFATMMTMRVFCFPAANSFFSGAINEQKIPFCRFSTQSVTFSFYSTTLVATRSFVSPSLSFTSDGCCVVKSGSVRENTIYD
jgi:hypothetical protein